MSYQAPQAVFIRKLDPESFLDELEVGRKEKPAVGAGQVLVRLLVRPVSPADILSVQGEFFSDYVLLVSKRLSMLLFLNVATWTSAKRSIVPLVAVALMYNLQDK
jgi:hypothetical protein